MALYNEILVGRINRAIQKFTGIKGQAPAPQLSAEVVFDIPLLWGVETRYLEGWNRFAANIGSAAQAANPSAVQLRNPANSNVIAILEQITVQGNTADNNGLQHGARLVDYTTIPSLANTRLDSRGNPQPTCILSNTSGAQSPVAFGATIDNVGITANNLSQRQVIIVFEHQEIPILPGDAVQVAGSANNVLLTVGFMWRERFLEESERT